MESRGSQEKSPVHQREPGSFAEHGLEQQMLPRKVESWKYVSKRVLEHNMGLMAKGCYELACGKQARKVILHRQHLRLGNPMNKQGTKKTPEERHKVKPSGKKMAEDTTQEANTSTKKHLKRSLVGSGRPCLDSVAYKSQIILESTRRSVLSRLYARFGSE